MTEAEREHNYKSHSWVYEPESYAGVKIANWLSPRKCAECGVKYKDASATELSCNEVLAKKVMDS